MARKTFTSSAVKTRWNNRHYDRVVLLLPKGDKEVLQRMAESKYGLTKNGYGNLVIRELMGVKQDDWKALYIGEKPQKEDEN